MNLITAIFKPASSQLKTVVFAGVNISLRSEYEWLFIKDAKLFASVGEPHLSVDENDGEWFWFTSDDYYVETVELGEFKFLQVPDEKYLDETNMKFYIGDTK